MTDKLIFGPDYTGSYDKSDFHTAESAKREFRQTQDDEKLSPDATYSLQGLKLDKCECAIENHKKGEPCAVESDKLIFALSEFVETTPIEKGGEANNDAADTSAASAASLLPTSNTAASKTVKAAAAALNCTSESCVVTHPKFKSFVESKQIMNNRELDIMVDLVYKTPGPRNSTALLSNYDIDKTLQKWGRVFTDFYPCPFAMMDFETNGDVFNRISIPDAIEGKVEMNLGKAIGVVKRPIKCFGCVLNTDTSRGPGKHWVAAFVDCRPPAGKPWTVEYFNSTGRPPLKPVIIWMERTRAELSAYRKDEVITVPVTSVDHQESQTECGLYALFYIRRRLEGTPYTFFKNSKHVIPDEAMVAFRQHVFR